MHNVFENSVWLLADKLSKLFPGILVLALLARHLGPQEFGIWSYAVALTTIIGTVAILGMDKIAVKELITGQSSQPVTVSTVIFMRIMAALCCMLISILIVVLTRPQQPVYLYCTFFSSFTILFQSFDVLDYFYQVKNSIRTVIIPKVSVFILFCLIKTILILLGGSLPAFLWVSVLELLVTYSIILWKYHRQYASAAFSKINFHLAARLLKQCSPLIYSSVLVVLFIKIDLLLLDYMSSATALGNYVVAARISELWYALPTVIATAMLPGLIRKKEENPAAYRESLETWIRLSCWLSIGIAVFITLSSPFIIGLLYGPAYVSAPRILRIHIWACIPVFIAAVVVQYLFVEGRYHLFVYGNAAGLLVNVAVNLWLIPAMAGTGAAIATVAAYTTVYSVMVCLDKSRESWKLTRKMLHPGHLYDDAKKVLRGLKHFLGGVLSFQSSNPLPNE
ncbi:flippase [Chitinophaga sp. 2R12]|uniref:Flippase n=1 Tax=Chitinophaga hostae TaxID=2831022 RepID=A0ABS5J6G4_9BACT|nr:flippase [Chitinophaga hostae]MBS0030811.1 flippase [Chitinophaga hostae]